MGLVKLKPKHDRAKKKLKKLPKVAAKPGRVVAQTMSAGRLHPQLAKLFLGRINCCRLRWLAC